MGLLDSKYELKITGLELFQCKIDPTVKEGECPSNTHLWHYDMELDREEKTDKSGRKYDYLEFQVKVQYMPPESEREYIRLSVMAYYETKRLKLKDVDEELWFYLVRISLHQCGGIISYKTKGTFLEKVSVPPLLMKSSAENDQKIRDIWG